MTNYEKIIKDNAQAYYTTGKQTLSDDTFDALVDKIRNDNPNSEVLTTGWGYSVSEKGKLKHKYSHVGSLIKVRTWEELHKKINSLDFDVSAKLDGMSIVLYFIKGKLEKAITRGDGNFGVDVTDKIKVVLGYDKISDTTFTGAVRGECMMCPSEFIEYKTHHPEAKNHRNSAVGLINGDDITEDYKYLKLFVYSVIGIEHINSSFVPVIHCENNNSSIGLYDWLKQNFKLVAPRVKLTLNSFDCKTKLEKLKKLWEKDVNIDGVVISNNNLNLQNAYDLAQNSVAWKFQEEEKVTTVKDIEWNMSKNSEMIPVLIIEPVELAGTTVKRVTGFNAKFIKENNLGKDAVISVCKRGEIIPYVKSVIKSINKNCLPYTCPHCKSKLVWDETNTHLICDNLNCEQKNESDIKAWCLSLAPVEGLGWKTIDKFLDIYLTGKNKDKTIDNIMSLSLIGEQKGELKLFNDMLINLHNRKIKVSEFLLALNVPGLGKISAQNWDTKANGLVLLDKLANSSEYTFSEIFTEVYNTVKDKSVVDLLFKDYHKKLAHCYNLVKDRLVVETENKNNKFKGIVCITGSLSIKRAEFENLLTSKGWKISNSITKSVNYLITNTPDSETTKNRKADELGIIKITESDFIEDIV